MNFNAMNTHAPKFSGTSIINNDVIKKMGVTSLPEIFRSVPGAEASWRHGIGVHYDTGMTFQDEKLVLNDQDKAIRKLAAGLAEQYYGGDIGKVLYQTPVSLTHNDLRMINSGLQKEEGWIA